MHTFAEVIHGLAMPTLTVRHVTTYRYRQPVRIGEHRMMLRPRDGHDQRVLESRLEITPRPTHLRWTQDVFGNDVAIARFAGRADMLRFESTVWLDHVPTEVTGRHIARSARSYPFTYDADHVPDLAPFFERQSLDTNRQIDAWVGAILDADRPIGTHGLLVKLNQTIHDTFTYVTRHEKGVQDPLLTLRLRRGSCRDLAVLLIEAARVLGLAARFVSGYLHVADADTHDDDGCDRSVDDEAGGNMHAWTQVYLPGPGWIDFDPTSGTVGNRDLIRVAVVRAPWQAIPLQGTWIGLPSDHLRMSVAVDVSRRRYNPAQSKPVRRRMAWQALKA